MRELVAGMKISLDGKIEGPEGFADWVTEWSDGYGMAERVDACVLGARMYPGYEQYWTAVQRNPPDAPLPVTDKPPSAGELAWARFAARTPHYVVSTSLQSVHWPHTTLLRSLDEVANLKQRSGKAIYLMGGAQITVRCLEAGLVDEMRLLLYPLIAGDGLALFATAAQRQALALKEARELPDGRVSLVYRMA